ncbi:MAG TPA: ATP-grasp domain-containing protein [Candidatus Polarisedimenticolia bacterium]|nr:ATP-grasp domain-containing protein [Candidatus Polarisedimenticolia bacterium]
MKRLLLLMTTATYRAGAFLQAADKLGLRVVVGSDRPQILAGFNPAAHLTLDFDRLEESAQAVVQFAARSPFAAIIAADDDGVELAAAASSALRLPHNSLASVRAARDKHTMRERLAAAGIASPPFRLVGLDEDSAALAASLAEPAAGALGFPCVVKPVGLAASRGVIRADTPDQLVTALQRVSEILRLSGSTARSTIDPRRILIEGYIPGEEVAVEGLVTDGRLRVLAVYDKPDPLVGPFFEETIYVTPSRKPSAVLAAVEACVGRVTAALGLTRGPVHAEVRCNEDGAWIIEIAPRSIGGLCSRTLRFRSGATLEEILLRHALGQDMGADAREETAAGVMMIPIPRRGILTHVTGREEAARLPGIVDIRLTIPFGQEVIPPPEGDRYLGFIFARAKAPAEVEAALRAAHGRLVFEIRQRSATETG